MFFVAYRHFKPKNVIPTVGRHYRREKPHFDRWQNHIIPNAKHEEPKP
jgi:hypothetical protein